MSVEHANQPVPEHIDRAATSFQAALSDIAHGRHTPARIAEWEKTARRLVPTPSRTIEGDRIREAILWAAPREALPVSSDLHLEAIDAEALLATVLMWRLDPQREFDLRECGRGEECKRERFYVRNRKYCSAECMGQVNRSTATERSRNRRERDKAVKVLKARYPARAKELMEKAKAPGLTADQIVERAEKINKRERRSW